MQPLSFTLDQDVIHDFLVEGSSPFFSVVLLCQRHLDRQAEGLDMAGVYEYYRNRPNISQCRVVLSWLTCDHPLRDIWRPLFYSRRGTVQ